jgi:cell wall-associated NlpC family hydrolase
MHGEMVLRRLHLTTVLLTFLLALAVPAAPALADHHRWGGGDPTSASDDGGATDQPAGDGSYGDPWDGGSGDDGSSSDDGSGPVAPATTTVPSTTTPSTTFPGTTLAPVTPIDVLPTIPVTKTIAGKVAKLRTDGKAAIPRAAPKRIQALIAAANRIVGKPYKWGGGHARLADTGYDCSGSVSYALIGAQLLAAPMVSGTLAHYAAAGAGRWLSIYANKGHVYLEVAGLRLDTSPVGDATRTSGVRWRPLIGKRAGFSTRHPLGL